MSIFSPNNFLIGHCSPIILIKAERAQLMRSRFPQCVCACVCACLCACMRVHACVCTHVCACMCAHMCVCASHVCAGRWLSLRSRLPAGSQLTGVGMRSADCPSCAGLAVRGRLYRKSPGQYYYLLLWPLDENSHWALLCAETCACHVQGGDMRNKSQMWWGPHGRTHGNQSQSNANEQKLTACRVRRHQAGMRNPLTPSWENPSH